MTDARLWRRRLVQETDRKGYSRVGDMQRAQKETVGREPTERDERSETRLSPADDVLSSVELLEDWSVTVVA